MLVVAFSNRVIGPFMALGQNVVHADTFELAWLRRGSYAARVDGQSWFVDSSYLALIAPGSPHSSWTLDEEIEESVLHLHQACGLPRTSCLVPIAGDLRAVLETFPTRTENRGDITPYAARLVEAFPRTRIRAEGSIDPRILRVVVRIVEDPTAKVTLEELARHAGLSVYHFNRLFREELGESPMRYVRSRKVGLAARLLQATERSISEIAHSTGFSSAGRLSEAFSDVMGCSPSAFRSAAGRPSHRGPL